MAAATEIVFIKVRDGIDLNDASSAGAQTFAKATTTLSEQKGFKRCYWVSTSIPPSLLPPPPPAQPNLYPPDMANHQSS